MPKRIFYHEFKPALFVSLWIGLYGFHKTSIKEWYQEYKLGLFMVKIHDWNR